MRLAKSWTKYFSLRRRPSEIIIATNVISKYADDTTLLVPEMCDVKIEDELKILLNGHVLINYS